MPRTSKGARLWLEPAERDKQGKVIRPEAYVIRDGKIKRRTKCSKADVERANELLAEYIGSKRQVSRERNRSAAEILIADALNMYYQHKVLGHGGHARPKETKKRIETLDAFWTPSPTSMGKSAETTSDRASASRGSPPSLNRPDACRASSPTLPRAVSWRTCAPRSIIKSKKASAARR